MTEGGQDLAAAEPFEITSGTDDTGEEFARFELTLHPQPGDSATADELSHRRHLFDNPDAHVHPRQEETIEVLSGTYAVAIDGTEHVLEAGEAVTVPPDTPHRQWNPTDRPIRVAHEHKPAMASAELYETLFALAQAGETDEKGLPNTLQLAVVLDAYPGHSYRPTPPVAVQQAMFKLLAPVGRLLGYEATHHREDVDARG